MLSCSPERIIEYLDCVMKYCFEANDASVRKTFVECLPVMFEKNQDACFDLGLIEQMQDLFKKETNSNVLMSIIVSFKDISQITGFFFFLCVVCVCVCGCRMFLFFWQ